MLKDFVENEKFLSKFQDMLEKSSYPDIFEDWGEAANLMDAMTRARKLHINALLFAEACQQKGVSQAGTLMDFMKKFIEENK